MRAARPVCACCGEPLRKDTDWIRFEPGTEPNSLEELKRRTNGEVVSVRWGMADRWLTAEELAEHDARWNRHGGTQRSTPPNSIRTSDPTRPRVITSASVWSGGYAARFNVFCTVNCAAAFGAASYRAGYRMKETP